LSVARDFNGTSDYIDLGDIDVGGLTLLNISIWFNAATLRDFDEICSKRDSALSGIGITLGGASYGDNNDILVYVFDGSDRWAWSTNDWIAADTWNHAFLAYNGGGATDADKLRFWGNGVQRTLTFSSAGVVTTTPNNARGFLICATYYSGIVGWLDGRAAELAIWAGGSPGGLTVEQAADVLSKGYSPKFLRLNGLHYFPLIGRNSPETDMWSSTTGTLNGAPTAFEHPRIINPAPLRYSYATAAEAEVFELMAQAVL
jgi:hypothetical protein